MGTITEKLTREKVTAIAAKLRDLPEREEAARAVTKQETVQLLSKEIKSLRRRGYSIREIAEILSNEGVSFTAATLSNFLWRAGQRNKPKREPAAERKHKADTPPARPRTTAEKGSFLPRPDTIDL